MPLPRIIKTALLSLACFAAAFAISIRFLDSAYQEFVSGLFIVYRGEKLHLYGKLNPFDYTTEIAFAICCFSFTWLLALQSRKKRLVQVGIAVCLFFFTTFISTFIDSLYVMRHCVWDENGCALNFSYTHTKFHFLLSLMIAILPLSLHTLNRKSSAQKHRTRHRNRRIHHERNHHQ